jgi:hypothetical protein
VAFVAQVISELDLEAPLQHVTHLIRQQATVTGQRDPFGAGLFNQSLGPHSS